jgi:hypothetical protein
MWIKATRFFFFICLCTFLLSACKKENDERKRFTGTFHLTGEGLHIIYGYLTYSETPIKDTADFTVTLSSDCDDCIIFTGVSGPRISGDHNLSFRLTGTPITVKVQGNSFTIPLQLPYSGSSMNIEGSGIFENDQMVLTYASDYRGTVKRSTVKGKKL